jgi:hypothetical protein
MSRWLPSFVSVQPGMVRPGLVTRDQVLLAAKTAIAAGVRAADDTLTRALARVQERWGSDPAQWLTFGMTLAMSQRILAEAGRPIDPAEREPA